MSQRREGKVAVITGGNSGIGPGSGRAFRSLGGARLHLSLTLEKR
jgi:NAD(P)-dependent dehydrogenase (short-subunit alcohol dehydrogenase family)